MVTEKEGFNKEISTPKSVVNREVRDVEVPEAAEEIAVNVKNMTTTSFLKQKTQTQAQATAAAKTIVATYEELGKTKAQYKLTWILALVTHHPAPRIGEFSFIDTYSAFTEGIKYCVPMYVAQHLEATGNAVIIGK